jgi:hypothetical protein
MVHCDHIRSKGNKQHRITEVLVLSSTYLGTGLRGQMEGKGVYRYKHGDSYEGTFLDSAPYGEGRYQYADGGFYQGEFKNLTHVNRHKGLQGAHRLPKCDGWRHGFGVVIPHPIPTYRCFIR